MQVSVMNVGSCLAGVGLDVRVGFGAAATAAGSETPWGELLWDCSENLSVLVTTKKATNATNATTPSFVDRLARGLPHSQIRPTGKQSTMPRAIAGTL